MRATRERKWAGWRDAVARTLQLMCLVKIEDRSQTSPIRERARMTGVEPHGACR